MREVRSQNKGAMYSGVLTTLHANCGGRRMPRSLRFIYTRAAAGGRLCVFVSVRVRGFVRRYIQGIVHRCLVLVVIQWDSWWAGA